MPACKPKNRAGPSSNAVWVPGFALDVSLFVMTCAAKLVVMLERMLQVLIDVLVEVLVLLCGNECRACKHHQQ
jgi:hypothetical protein